MSSDTEESISEPGEVDVGLDLDNDPAPQLDDDQLADNPVLDDNAGLEPAPALPGAGDPQFVDNPGVDVNAEMGGDVVGVGYVVPADEEMHIQNEEEENNSNSGSR